MCRRKVRRHIGAFGYFQIALFLKNITTAIVRLITYHTIHPFKVHNSMVLLRVMHNQSSNILITPKKQLSYLSALTLPFPQPQATTTLFTVSTGLPVLGISCNQNHICGLLCLAFSLRKMFSCSSMW